MAAGLSRSSTCSTYLKDRQGGWNDGVAADAERREGARHHEGGGRGDGGRFSRLVAESLAGRAETARAFRRQRTPDRPYRSAVHGVGNRSLPPSRKGGDPPERCSEPAADTRPVHLRERTGRAPRCAKPGSTALRACAARASRRSPTSPCPPLRPGRSGCCPRRSPSRRGAGILASIRSRSSSTPGRAGLP